MGAFHQAYVSAYAPSGSPSPAAGLDAFWNHDHKPAAGAGAGG